MDGTSSLFHRFLSVYQKDEVICEEGNQGSEMFIIHHPSWQSKDTEEDCEGGGYGH